MTDSFYRKETQISKDQLPHSENRFLVPSGIRYAFMFVLLLLAMGIISGLVNDSVLRREKYFASLILAASSGCLVDMYILTCEFCL